MKLVKRAIEKFKALSHFLHIRKLTDLHFILLNDQKPRDQKFDFKERSYFIQKFSHIFGFNDKKKALIYLNREFEKSN